MAIEYTAAQGKDGVSAADCPEHARLLEARTDHCSTASFDDAGTLDCNRLSGDDRQIQLHGALNLFLLAGGG